MNGHCDFSGTAGTAGRPEAAVVWGVLLRIGLLVLYKEGKRRLLAVSSLCRTQRGLLWVEGASEMHAASLLYI